MRTNLPIVAVVLSLGLWTGPASANEIETACRALNTASATDSRCRCVGVVAVERLTAADRRKVVKWFSDPHQAQVVRQSDRRRDEKLWARYKEFGEAAAKTCG